MVGQDILLQYLWILLLIVVCWAASAGGIGERLVVDGESGELRVLKPGVPTLIFENISVGRYGTSADKTRGDNTTPRGIYRIGWIKRDSAFGTFIGLNYPGVADAQRGLRDGLITQSEYRSILRAHRSGEVPPQNTALGGYIGIHGLGNGDPRIHGVYNWTKGCVALNDEQLHSLLPKLRLGMSVEIR